MILLLIFYLGVTVSVALIGKQRQIGFWQLFVVSLLFTPFVGIVVGLNSKKLGNPLDVLVIVNQREPDEVKLPKESPSKMRIED